MCDIIWICDLASLSGPLDRYTHHWIIHSSFAVWSTGGWGGVEQQSIMLKYVPFPLWSAGPLWLLFVPRWLSWLRGSLCLKLGPHYVWQRSEEAGRGRGGRKDKREGGRDEARCTEIGLLLLLISWMNQLMLFCALFLLIQREKGRGYSASCLWHGSRSLSLAHSVTIIPSISMLLATVSTQENLWIHNLSETLPVSCGMHLSPVVLWQWSVCSILGLWG